MNLTTTEDERDLAAAFRSLLTTHCSTDVVRQSMSPGSEFPHDLWQALVGADVLALPFPEAFGGAGGSLDDLAVFALEAGRALCPNVVLSTLHLGLAVNALGDDSHRTTLLPAICRGEIRGAVALHSPYDATDVRPALRAEPVSGPDGPAFEVSGDVDFVADADLAHLMLLTAVVSTYGEPDRLVGLLVDPNSAGVTTSALPTSGGDRWQRVRLNRVQVAAGDVLAGDGGRGLAADDLHRVALTIRALQCLDMVGGAQAVLERTVAYTVGREQFGRPIASFQAAQHLVANVHIAVQGARLAARSAVFWLGRGQLATRATAVAVMSAATAYRRATLDAHQLHAGMGYVLETDLHLWSERARQFGAHGGGADVAAGWLEKEIGLPNGVPKTEKAR